MAHEQQSSGVRRGGLPPSYNTAQRLQEAHDLGHDVLPKASVAAQRIFNTMNQDPKTGLLKQEAFLINLGSSIETLQDGETLITGVGDLDGFKAVNDKFGHDTGDMLLGIVGEILQQAYIRSADTVARGSREGSGIVGVSGHDNLTRLGGDEFAVFSISNPNEAPAIERRSDSLEEYTTNENIRLNNLLREHLVGTKFENCGVNIAISIGFATYKPGFDAKTLFVQADKAMLQVKYKGKLDKITTEDRERIREIIPFLESKGARVEGWLYEAAALPKKSVS